MTARRLRHVGHILLLAAAIGAAASPAANAARGLTLGFSSDADLTGGTSTSRAPWIQRALSEGATIVRVDVVWAQVAPRLRPARFEASNPASSGYNWSSVDSVVRDLNEHGLQVLLEVHDAPTWAQGPGKPGPVQPGTWRPNPRQFGEFAKAAALRYDGSFPDPANPGASLPRVRYWQAWNEANLDYYLAPQWIRSGSAWTAVAPVIFRQLVNSFYSSVKSVSASNFVLMGGTAPYGDAVGTDPVGQERTPPVAFYRDVFCLHGAQSLTPVSCADPIHFDGLDHHPYGVGGPTWHAINADDVAVPDIYKITRVMNAALRTGRALPEAPKSTWVSEMGWSSNPPNPQGVPVAEDARWLEQAMYVLWAQGVNVILPLEIGDPPPIPNYSSVFESGLYYLNGQPKPLAEAYRFPFVTRRTSRDRVIAWGRAPQAGELSLERLQAGRWRTIRRFAAGAGHVFDVTIPLVGRATLRAGVGSEVSLTWVQGA